jgi:hypothetical protein
MHVTDLVQQFSLIHDGLHQLEQQSAVESGLISQATILTRVQFFASLGRIFLRRLWLNGQLCG